MVVTDARFKLEFKQASILNIENLAKDIASVFEWSNHHSHSVLHRYYKKFPFVSLDKELARKILRFNLDGRGCYIVNYDAPFQGGDPKSRNSIVNDDELHTNNATNEAINLNWARYLDQLRTSYWAKNENIDRIHSLGDFDFYEARLPRNAREQYLSSGQDIFINGQLKKVKYEFFNITQVLKFYQALVDEFYPEYKFIKRVSSSKIRRFGKDIGNNMYLGLYVDFGFLEAELKRTYLELPQIKIEIFSKDLNSYLKETMYLNDQEDFPIARINCHYFIGNPIDYRIGNSSMEQEDLKRNLFYSFDVYTFYLKKYLNVVEKSISQIMQNEA